MSYVCDLSLLKKTIDRGLILIRKNKQAVQLENAEVQEAIAKAASEELQRIEEQLSNLA